jgi:hypothetical protein
MLILIDRYGADDSSRKSALSALYFAAGRLVSEPINARWTATMSAHQHWQIDASEASAVRVTGPLHRETHYRGSTLVSALTIRTKSFIEY